jgi:HAD superfamily hydrolase (TIGR01509 family)
MPAAVIFDLDGVLVDSESVWDAARRQVVEGAGGRWRPDATRAMMGMSSPEWAAYLRDQLGTPASPSDIVAAVVAVVEEMYAADLPLLPDAVDTVHELASTWPLGLASSSNRPIIELVLDRSGLRPCFAATVSSEEVPRGKPAPDVYAEAARRLGVDARSCVAVEDSTNGIWSAVAAGLAVVAVPNREFPPSEAALEAAAIVVDRLGEVTVELIEGQNSRS